MSDFGAKYDSFWNIILVMLTKLATQKNNKYN